ncbi:hypothetical protein GCM10010218_02420 [Streptomyces mashuensis]|uniref:ABC transporter n=1 Tax=Streptomyces mashuensis TaxID=33904 RepID=A0A919ATY4_9ACTN|nr:ABC transporter [Streptomyces mashuensis]GHF25264.1 hypothetical protein GCM10010218_02420 [Streptomyces mashuensis]
MTALLRYQCALLLRSHRWLPPLLLYVAFLGIGVRPSEPVLGSLGFAAAALLPTAAWLVRVCVTQEPDAARQCAAAAAAPWRVHLASLLTALLASATPAVIATAVVTAVSDPYTAGRRAEVALGPAAVQGVVAALICVLLGTAGGALCNRPVLRGTAWTVPATVLVSFPLLFLPGSPARAAVTGLSEGSRTGAVVVPWPGLAGAAVLATCAWAGACALSARR